MSDLCELAVIQDPRLRRIFSFEIFLHDWPCRMIFPRLHNRFWKRLEACEDGTACGEDIIPIVSAFLLDAMPFQISKCPVGEYLPIPLEFGEASTNEAILSFFPSVLLLQRKNILLFRRRIILPGLRSQRPGYLVVEDRDEIFVLGNLFL